MSLPESPAHDLGLRLEGPWQRAAAFAGLLGTNGQLSPTIFAENPVLVRNGNIYHVRAIQQIYGEHGLTFLSAIDNGLLLTLGRGKEIIRTLGSGIGLVLSVPLTTGVAALTVAGAAPGPGPDADATAPRRAAGPRRAA